MDETVVRSKRQKVRFNGQSMSKVKTPSTTNATHYVAVSNQETQILVDEQSKDPPSDVKRKKAKTKPQDVPLEERLKEMATEAPTTSQGKSSENEISPEAVSMLLVQGLHSKDKDIIEKVLNETSATVIDSTVKQIPVQTVVPLLEEIACRMRTKHRLSSYLHWLKAVLTCHMSYISSHPDVITKIGEIFGHFDSRLQMLDRLLRIQGKLSLLLERASSAAVAKNAYADQPAEIVYEEASSEDEMEVSGVNVENEDWDNLGLDSESDAEEESGKESSSEESETESGGENHMEDEEEDLEENLEDEEAESAEKPGKSGKNEKRDRLLKSLGQSTRFDEDEDEEDASSNSDAEEMS